MRWKSHNLCWGVWNDWARRGCVQPLSAKGVFPIGAAWFLWNINVKLLLPIRDESAPISSIRAELLNRRMPLICLFSSRYPAFCVMNVGSMNHNRQQAARHIHCDVPLSIFPPSIPVCSICSCASPVYSGAISSHCSSVKSLGYRFRFFFNIF